MTERVNKNTEIHQIRNATIIITYNGMKFLIDPWLCPKDSMSGFEGAYNSEIRQPRVDLPLRVEDITGGIDAVILTHVHPDHWDDIAAKSIRKDISFFVQSEIDLTIVQSLGFSNVTAISHEGTIFKGVTLYKTSCQHGRREIVKPMCESMGMPYDCMGVVFKVEGIKSVYVTGDTIWCDEVKDSIDKHKPDIIIINACGARLLNGERLIMDLEDVKEISSYASQSTIIASHMDTVSHLTVTRDDIKKEALKNVIVPDDGEKIAF